MAGVKHTKGVPASDATKETSQNEGKPAVETAPADIDLGDIAASPAMDDVRFEQRVRDVLEERLEGVELAVVLSKYGFGDGVAASEQRGDELLQFSKLYQGAKDDLAVACETGIQPDLVPFIEAEAIRKLRRPKGPAIH